jgi:hypothetical protein
LKLEPAHDTAALNLAALLFDRARFAEAARLCEVVQKRTPNLAPAEIILSRIAFLEGRLDEGLDRIRTAAQLEPHSTPIATEYVWAELRRYWTYDPGEFRGLFDAASKGELDAALLPRLLHQSLAKIIRPRMLQLLTGTPEQAPATQADGGAIGVWTRELSTTDAESLGILGRNFDTAAAALWREPSCGPQDATLTLRDGTTKACMALADTDPLCGGCIPLITLDRGCEYIPFGLLSSITFAKLGEVIECEIRTTDGVPLRGHTPLFGFFTMFCKDPAIRSGGRSRAASITESVATTLGERMMFWRDGVSPLRNIARIEFIRE